LLHIDIKRLGRFDRVGHRITRKRSFGSPKQGFEFVYVAIDDFTRLSYVDILVDERSESASSFLRRAVEWFAQQNVTVERVMTDNDSAFLAKEFATTCYELSVRHKRTRPYTPRTNGKAERFIETLLPGVGLSLLARQLLRVHAVPPLLQLPPRSLRYCVQSTHLSLDRNTS